MVVIVWCSEENRVWESALSFHLMVLGTGLMSLSLATSSFLHQAISLVRNDIFLVGLCSFSLISTTSLPQNPYTCYSLT